MTEHNEYATPEEHRRGECANHELGTAVGNILRYSEHVASDFSARVVAELRSQGGLRLSAGGRARSLLKPRTLHVRVGEALAIAAGLAAIAFVGGSAASGVIGGRAGVADVAAVAPAATRADTVYVVRFLFSAPAARSVALVGSFNGWSAEETPLTATDVDGLWSATVTLPSGNHEYAFVVDDERWAADPLAASFSDPLGIETSMLRLHGDTNG